MAVAGDFVGSALYVVIFLVVIILVGLGLWLLKSTASGGSIGLFNSRERRLSVVEAAAIGSQRRLVLVRRDNVEHLLMVGGPVDVIVETGIAANQPLAEHHGAEPSASEKERIFSPIGQERGHEQPRDPLGNPMPRPSAAE